MKNDRIETSYGLASVLTIIFVIAKLLGLIDWSWWIVFLPAIISFGLSLLLLIIIIIIYIWTH